MFLVGFGHFLVLFLFATAILIIFIFIFLLLVASLRRLPSRRKVGKESICFRAHAPAGQVGDEPFRVRKGGLLCATQGLYIARGACFLQLEDGDGALQRQDVGVVVEADGLRGRGRGRHAGLVWLGVRECLACLGERRERLLLCGGWRELCGREGWRDGTYRRSSCW